MIVFPCGRFSRTAQGKRRSRSSFARYNALTHLATPKQRTVLFWIMRCSSRRANGTYEAKRNKCSELHLCSAISDLLRSRFQFVCRIMAVWLS